MANNNGTNVTAPIRPFSTEDEFPTAFAKEIGAGFRIVATIAEMEAIPELRLRDVDGTLQSTIIWVVAENKFYKPVDNTTGITFEEAVFGLQGITGEQIVSLLHLLDHTSKLQSSDVTYGTRTVKEVLDLLLAVNEGLIDITVQDGSYFVPNIQIDFRNESTGAVVSSVTNANGKIIRTLPSGKYRVTVNRGKYDIINIGFSDNDASDNSAYVSGSSIHHVDIGAYTATVDILLRPSSGALLNSFKINNDAAFASNPDLELTIATDSIVNEYMVGKDAAFTGSGWQPWPTTGLPTYYFDFQSDIILTLYVKIRNNTGESQVLSDSITLKSAVLRSDNNKTYRTLKLAMEDLLADYGDNLTQNVTISVEAPLDLVGTSTYYEVLEFNQNSEYFLTIDGKSNLTYDCHSVGGLKFTKCSNLIIKGIHFVNVANMVDASAPEQCAAIFIQGEPDNWCKNIIIKDLTITGYHDPLNPSGQYGLVLRSCDIVTISGVEMVNIQAIGCKVADTKITSIINCNFHNMAIYDRGIISQPCLIEVSRTEFLYIEDSIIDGLDSDTLVIATNVGSLVSKRNTFINAGSEAFRFSSTSVLNLLEFENTIIAKCLSNPYYSWTKQFVTFGEVKKLVLRNNTFHITPVDGNSFYTKLFNGAMARKIEYYNNIFLIDFQTPEFTNNNGQAVIFQIASIDAMVGDYNIYSDYTEDGLVISNMFVNTEDPDSTIYLNRCKNIGFVRMKGCDLNSTILDITNPIFSDSNYKTLVSTVAAINGDGINSPKWDRARRQISENSNPIGAYYKNSVPIELTEESYFAYSYGMEELQAGTPFSASTYDNLYFIGVHPTIGSIYKWQCNSPTTNVIAYGSSVAVQLIAELDPNTSAYIAPEVYTLVIEKI